MSIGNINFNLLHTLPNPLKTQFLINVEDEDTFHTLLSMNEFYYLHSNSLELARIYKERLEKYYPNLLELSYKFYEEMPWEELYNRLMNLYNLINSLKMNNNTYFGPYDSALKYAQKGKAMEFLILYYLFPEANKDVFLTNFAGYGGSIKIFEYLKSIGLLPTYNSLVNAESKNYLDLMKWIVANSDIKPDILIANNAVLSNHLEILKWLYEQKIYPSTEAIAYSLRNNNLEILKWLKSKFDFKISPYDLPKQDINNETKQWLIENKLARKYDFE